MFCLNNRYDALSSSPGSRGCFLPMAMGDVCVEISRTQISSFASFGSLFAAAESADKDGAKCRLLDARERVQASRAPFVRRVFGAVETKHVLARNQSAVYQNRQIAFLASVNRRIGNFFSREIDLGL